MRKKPASSPSNLPIRCAIYARTASVKMPSEANSIDHQIAACKRFAKRRGWTVRRAYIFTDSGLSGLTINSGLKEIMRFAAAKVKPFEVLLCASIDRIARDSSLLIQVQDFLDTCGVEMFFANEQAPEI